MCSISDDVEILQAMRTVRVLRMGVNPLPQPLDSIDIRMSKIIDDVVFEMDALEAEMNKKLMKKSKYLESHHKSPTIPPK